MVIKYYPERSIIPFVKSIIKENGYFYIETFYLSPQKENQGVANQYKLYPKEWLTTFGVWKVLYSEENEQGGTQTVLCQKKMNEGYQIPLGW